MTNTSQHADRRRPGDDAGPDERASKTQLGSAPDPATAAREVRVATPLQTQPHPPTLAPNHESTTRRIAAASRAWLGTRTWPAYGAAGITAAYGLLKAYWVFGGTALWSIAPLPEEMIEKARSHTAPRWFEIADAATVVLAVAGVFFALATVRARRWLPVALVRWSLWPLAVLMVLRAMLAIVGDVQQVVTGSSTRTTLWDLVLWSPLFLIWGLLWAATALTYACRAGRRTRLADELMTTTNRGAARSARFAQCAGAFLEEGQTMQKMKEAASEFLTHKRVAVTGVSRTPGSHGSNVVYQRLRDRGYQVFAVNPNADAVEGDTCYHDLRSIPGGVDWVVIGTAPERADDTMRECAELGIQRVWMHRGPGRGSVSQSAAEYGRQHNIKVIDGGCPCMFDPTADAAHKAMRVMLTLTGRVPRRV